MRRSTLILTLIILTFSVFAMPVNSAAAAPASVNIVIDSDTGVDASAATAYLLSSPQANIIGITEVAGNTTVKDRFCLVFAVI